MLRPQFFRVKPEPGTTFPLEAEAMVFALVDGAARYFFLKYDWWDVPLAKIAQDFAACHDIVMNHPEKLRKYGIPGDVHAVLIVAPNEARMYELRRLARGCSFFWFTTNGMLRNPDDMLGRIWLAAGDDYIRRSLIE